MAETNKTDQLKSKMLGTGGDNPPAPSNPATNGMKHYADERTSIVRQSCLKSAAQVIAGFTYKTEVEALEAVKIMAEGLENWVNR